MVHRPDHHRARQGDRLSARLERVRRSAILRREYPLCILAMQPSMPEVSLVHGRADHR